MLGRNLTSAPSCRAVRECTDRDRRPRCSGSCSRCVEWTEAQWCACPVPLVFEGRQSEAVVMGLAAECTAWHRTTEICDREEPAPKNPQARVCAEWHTEIVADGSACEGSDILAGRVFNFEHKLDGDVANRTSERAFCEGFLASNESYERLWLGESSDGSSLSETALRRFLGGEESVSSGGGEERPATTGGVIWEDDVGQLQNAWGCGPSLETPEAAPTPCWSQSISGCGPSLETGAAPTPCPAEPPGTGLDCVETPSRGLRLGTPEELARQARDSAAQFREYVVYLRVAGALLVGGPALWCLWRWYRDNRYYAQQCEARF